jgi:hypothetical protein
MHRVVVLLRRGRKAKGQRRSNQREDKRFEHAWHLRRRPAA